MVFGATSYKDTKFGIIARNKLTKLEIEGITKGLRYVKRLSTKKNVAVTPELIKDLHRKSFGWIFPKWAGKFRTVNVTYSGNDAPEFFKINELITNLCLDLEEQLKYLPEKDDDGYLNMVIKILAWFQHRFVQIHPFNDYNGRTARLLTTLLLVKFRLPPIEIKSKSKQDRKTYILAMQKADSGDYSSLEKLISESLNEGLKSYVLRSDLNSIASEGVTL